MPPLIIAGEALAAGGAAEGAAVGGTAAAGGAGATAAEGAAVGEGAATDAAESRTARPRRFVQERLQSRFETQTRADARPANDNRVSPLVWFFFGVSVLLDLFKVLLLFFSLLPIVGLIITATGSFFISVVEVTVVFGGLWALGVYKSPKSGTLFTLLTMGVTAIDLVPIADDFPFTSPTVFFMIMRSIAEQKAGGFIAGAATRARSAASPANDDAP